MRAYFYIIILILASIDAKADSLRLSVSKNKLKQGDQVQIIVSRLNNSKRRVSKTGLESIKEYVGETEEEARSRCEQNIEGSDLLNLNGVYPLNNPGKVYLKPIVSGINSSCYGPITVIPDFIPFERISVENLGKSGEFFSLKAQTEDFSGNIAITADKLSVSMIASGSGCSGPKIPRTRVMTLSPKNGVALLKVKKPSRISPEASSFSVRFVSGERVSCVDLIISQQSVQSNYRNGISSGGQYHKSSNNQFSIISNIGSPVSGLEVSSPDFIIRSGVSN